MKYEYKIHGDKGPLIVIENGLGNTMYGWFHIIEAFKIKARVLTYHRKGYGSSEGYSKERTVSNISSELKDLLEYLNISESFILVGHSFGGLITQYFSLKYPELIKGLVLVDSTSIGFEKLHSAETPKFNDLLSIETLTSGWMKIYEMEHDEFSQTLGDITNFVDKHLTESDQENMIEFLKKQERFKTVSEEMRNFKTSSDEIKSINKTLNIKLQILARDSQASIDNFVKYDLPEKEAEHYEKIWRKLQKELLLFSNNSEFTIAEGSDHCIMEEKPDYVIHAIEEVMK